MTRRKPRHGIYICPRCTNRVAVPIPHITVHIADSHDYWIETRCPNCNTDTHLIITPKGAGNLLDEGAHIVA